MMNAHDIVVSEGPGRIVRCRGGTRRWNPGHLDRRAEPSAGGILNQCIHNGFGLHAFKEELTGPEYAQRYIDMVTKRHIPALVDTMVLDVQPHQVTYINREEGVVTISAKAIILAMGCRERPRGALNIPGYRPAGIYSAGTAQRLMNIEGCKVGSRVVILGSGDIGLIMARRMTLEGAKVKVVAELMPFSVA
jgi:NADPH-dependent 2,4-dienoyl-CoA reductase/sulfur reductase-like enzyme